MPVTSRPAFFTQVVDHRPHPGRHVPVARPQQPERPRIGADKLPLRQNLNNFPAQQRFARGKERQAANPQMTLNGIQPPPRMICRVAPLREHRFCLTAEGELPAGVGGRLSQRNTAVVAKRLRMPGRPRPAQIFRSRADNVGHGHQRLTVEAGRGASLLQGRKLRDRTGRRGAR